MKDVAVNRSSGQAPKRTRRTSISKQVKQLKDAGVPVTRLIVEPNGRHIIELAGAESQAETSPLEEWKQRRGSAAA